jgi:NAD(P)-dependent dehydrogenase (short-subunit alcohol dehydrogenase family)
VPARDISKARSNLPDWPDVGIETMDLLDPASIDAFANRFLDQNATIHTLDNNVGVMMAPLARDGRGYESQFSANHLGHFQLTCRVWALKVLASSRSPPLRTAEQALTFTTRIFCTAPRRLS